MLLSDGERTCGRPYPIRKSKGDVKSNPHDHGTSLARDNESEIERGGSGTQSDLRSRVKHEIIEQHTMVERIPIVWAKVRGADRTEYQSIRTKDSLVVVLRM
jgi:hypothetical protein